MSLEPNAQFGQYRIVRLLGRGGMGEVYDAEHRVLHRRYALKLLPEDFAARPESIRRFEREAEVMANLEHPNIVRVDEFGETGGRYWLRMELVRGIAAKAGNGKQELQTCISLGDYATTQGEKIEECEFAHIMEQALEALAYAHDKGVVHRDLKPGNLLLDRDSDGYLRVKISDFGLARMIGEEFLRSQAEQIVALSLQGDARTNHGIGNASTQARLGTWEYMAPEQKRGELADARSDIYAVGLICYRLLTGKNLGRKAASALVPSLDKNWDAFIDKALEEDASERPAHAGEMMAAFQSSRSRWTRFSSQSRMGLWGTRPTKPTARGGDWTPGGTI